MNKIEGTRGILEEEVFSVSKKYLEQAVKDIDAQFGEGYSKENPYLVGQYINMMTNKLSSLMVTSTLQEIPDALYSISKSMK